MSDTEVVKYLEAFLEGRLRDWSEKSQQATTATLVTCMDGRLTPLMRPFRHVIRTAGAMIEPVEGSVGLGIDATAVTFLATHGDAPERVGRGFGEGQAKTGADHFREVSW